jgi:ABC-type nitrate/sulfonate/bicarbonate transport system substrate-binding protein
VEYAGYWFADANGYFREAGIASTIVAGGPSTLPIEALVAVGQADVGIDQFDRVAGALAKGADLVVIGSLYQTDPSALLSLPAHPVRAARDIVGKRIGVQQGGRLFIDAILKLNDLPPDYTEVVVGSDPEPLLQGACDAFLCYGTNQPLALAVQHVPHVVARFEELGYVTYASSLFCRRDYLRANRTALVAYLRALQRGWQANFRDPVRGAELTVQTYGASLGLSLPHQIAMNRAQIPLMENAGTRAHGLLWMDMSRIAGPVYATLRAAGRTNLPPPAQYVDLSLLEDAGRPR